MNKTFGIKNLIINKFLYLILITLSVFSTSVVFGQGSPKTLSEVPSIRTVGILPIDNFTQELNLKRVQLFSLFEKAVTESQRFRIISSSLVETMSSNSSDRAQLVNQFEIDAFLKLKIISSKNNDIIFEITLTDTNLEPLMFEQDSYTINYLNSISTELLEEKIKTLTFRFINRIPYDTVVTSIQGDYLTIDTGINQQVKKGDKVEIIRSFIETRHPLNGTWVKFKNLNVGTGTIEEVKDKVSIVKLISSNSELKIGDGVKLEQTVTRQKFSNTSSTSFNDIDKHSIVYPKPETTPEPEPETKEPVNKTPPPVEPPKINTTKTDDGYPLKALFHSLFNLATLEVGINSWQFEKVSAKVPSGFLINTFLVHTGKYIEDSIGYDINLDFGFGPTKHGNYWGASGDADIFWLKALKDIDYFSTIKVGMGIRTDNLSVSREIFGGWNDFYFRFLLGTENDVDILNGEKLNWTVNMYFVPAILGTVGYNNSKRTLQSSNGVFLEALFILLGSEEAFEYGVSWRMGFMNMETKDYDFKYTMFRLSFCARRTF